MGKKTVLSNGTPAFGSSVAICGDNAVVLEGSTNYHSKAYIYHNESGIWSGPQIITANDQNNKFVSVAISSNYLVIGKINGNQGYINIYKNENDSWTKLGNDNQHMGSDFNYGMGLALDDHNLIVGRPDTSPSVVYFYE